jgi:hypothetical protein
MSIAKKTSLTSLKSYRTPEHPFPHMQPRGCECPGCNFHIARLEEMNSQLAQECDRLRRENESFGKAVAA